ncbi:hypothetical protein [Arthrobacter sp. L77]|uniref:hypothetical protein n=1 Tax=Arthrobacter sp. L77 TaxID=1496689 RepID=UPI0005BC3BBB|nr:hypothetical protein [Arthrobacter sp. L77]
MNGPGTAATAATARPVRRRAHWAVQVLAVFVAGRLVSTVVFLLAAARQGPSPWSGPAPGYGAFINFWDSGWYERIFTEGYPSELPLDALGMVTHNQWAFYPLYPGLVRGLAAVTGLGWGVLAPVVSVVAAAGASLVIYRLFRLRAEHRTALAGVAVVSFAPVAAILQVPYAESLHLLLLASALYLVSVGRYGAAGPVVVLMGLARPAGVPFAIAMGILFLHALWAARRGDDPGARRTAAGRVLPLFLLGVVSSAAAVAWPLIAWAATGRPTAYVATETAWRGEALVPFLPWFEAPAAVVGPAAGVLVVVGLVIGAAGMFLAPSVRSIGLVPGAWCAAYLLYLAAFWDPQSSTWRILLPLFPLALAVASPRGGRLLWVLLPVCVLLQFLWVDRLWAWTPTGPDGDYPP